jgi:uncharacterized protein YbjT (DUF2867 family)
VSNILVLGGTGFVGRALIAKLVERSGGAGGRIIVPTHRLMRGRLIQALPTVETVEADVHDEARLTRLVRGCDAVVNLVAILHGSQAQFEQVHVELPRKLARACTATGVRRLLHVSALGAASDAPSKYLRSKAAGEAVLQTFAAAPRRVAAGVRGTASSRIELTMLRPSVMFGVEDRFLNLFARLQSILPVVPLAGADALFQPVWVEDVATAIATCLTRTATIGQTFECAGPRVYSLRDLVRLAAQWSGHPRPVIALPPALGRLQAALMELAPGTPLMSRDNLDSMRVPNVASGTLPGLKELGITPSALEAIAPEYLARAAYGRGRLNALRAAAGRR